MYGLVKYSIIIESLPEIGSFGFSCQHSIAETHHEE